VAGEQWIGNILSELFPLQIKVTSHFVKISCFSAFLDMFQWKNKYEIYIVCSLICPLLLGLRFTVFILCKIFSDAKKILYSRERIDEGHQFF